MSNPSTFKAEPSGGGIDWDDAATLHRGDDSGLFTDMKAVRHGGLAELIRFVTHLPEGQQGQYSILKAGDHRLGIGEILALSRRPDFPRA